MEKLIQKYLIQNWQRKTFAIIVAIVVWFFVNNSIVSTKTIPNVPVRIINLPADKTIQGLLSNGILNKRLSLTLTGTKDIIEQIEPGDLEVLIDASTYPDEGIVQITKKNLVSLNPDLDLSSHISNVSHVEFVLKMSPLITAQIPIIINPPIGRAPEGYEYLDIWPQSLKHTVTGPEEQVTMLKKNGIELIFDLNDVTAGELNRLSTQQHQQNDEVSFLIPSKWKMVLLPFYNNAVEEINDPEAQNLHIVFLRKKQHPLTERLPIRVFYPPENSDVINPTNYSLAANEIITSHNGLTFLSLPLFVGDVSRLFLETIRNHLEITIIAKPMDSNNNLTWGVQFINRTDLENAYVKALLHKEGYRKDEKHHIQLREEFLRQRFCDYLQRFTLYTPESKKLKLKGKLEGNKIIVQEEE